MIHWLTTAPNPRSPATGYDAGQRGWRLHAVEAPEKASFADTRAVRALCGLLPRHGWGLDLFIGDDARCQRCSTKAGLPDTLFIARRKQIAAEMRAASPSQSVVTEPSNV